MFNVAVKQELLEENPFRNLPRDRRASMQQKVGERKTVDTNKVLAPEEGLAIYERMISDKRGNRDTGFELCNQQAVTCTRFQEVAGLRCCDFAKRIFEGQTYR